MKKIFEWLKTKVHNIADIQNCGEEDCYPWEKKNCRGCVNRRVSVKAVLKLINEAEAKWEAEKPRAFDADAVYRKMWKESEEVCGNTMIELERANEIILEELAGGVE